MISKWDLNLTKRLTSSLATKSYEGEESYIHPLLLRGSQNFDRDRRQIRNSVLKRKAPCTTWGLLRSDAVL